MVIAECPICGEAFEKHGSRKYCSEQCSRKAEWKKEKLRREFGLTPDESRRFSPIAEPTETIPILGYNLAPEEASRLHEIIRMQGREAVLDS